ncbi:MAG: ChbG/HpnK family deacetylase [Gammaproteobacteria bacterium]|nr:ChbG/HpnK family deacetylase [Gammaproteobacteria bacterium]
MFARVLIVACTIMSGMVLQVAQAQTFAERLGYPAGARVVILHVDDAGMSHQSNVGTMRSLTEGVANSVSLMMPCPWVAEFRTLLNAHPDLDVGLHLTLTSEWMGYRWGPLASRDQVKGLLDPTGALWPTVEAVAKHASAEEVELEIRAQIAHARAIGIQPTHLDSHMGTLFARDDFLERYIRVGAEEKIPVMFPGGHATALRAQLTQEARTGVAEGRIAKAQAMAETVWALGLPVLDDLHNTSYGWTTPADATAPDSELVARKVQRYTDALRSLQPGVTMVIMHSTDSDRNFSFISESGPTRRGDMLAMLDAGLRDVIQSEGIVLTTWRELGERRKRVAQ